MMKLNKKHFTYHKEIGSNVGIIYMGGMPLWPIQSEELMEHCQFYVDEENLKLVCKYKAPTSDLTETFQMGAKQWTTLAEMAADIYHKAGVLIPAKTFKPTEEEHETFTAIEKLHKELREDKEELSQREIKLYDEADVFWKSLIHSHEDEIGNLEDFRFTYNSEEEVVEVFFDTNAFTEPTEI